MSDLFQNDEDDNNEDAAGGLYLGELRSWMKIPTGRKAEDEEEEETEEEDEDDEEETDEEGGESE